MIKVEIKNLNNEITNGAVFATQQEADEWIVACELQQLWGKVGGFYPLSSLSPEELLTELSRTTVSELGEPLEEPLVSIPKQYSIVQTDITAEAEKAARVAKSRKAVDLGADIMAHIREVNLSKNMDYATFQALLADTSLERIERFLWNGAFETAKLLIQSYQGSFYTAEEKAEIIAMVDAAILQVS